MRILAIADVHGNNAAVYLVNEIYGMHTIDAVLVAGDITPFGDPSFALEFLNALPAPTFAVPGNCDSPEVIGYIEKSRAENLHMKTAEFKGFKLIGLGGTTKKGFSMGITFSDEFAETFISSCAGCIVLTHQPPFEILDDAGGGVHIGSRGIRKGVDNAKPVLVVSGHVHEARGYVIKNGTIFVNPGPAKYGYAAIVDITKKSVEMIQH